MTKKGKFFLIGGICITATFFVSLASLFIYLVAYTIKQSNIESRITEEFSTWCTGERYIYHDLDTEFLKFPSGKKVNDYGIKVEDTFSDVCSFKKTWPLLHKSHFVYFSGIEKLNDVNERYCIYKANYDFSYLKRVYETKTMDGNLSVKCTYGFENSGYFAINGKYYIFDFQNEEMETVEYIDEMVLLSGEDEYIKPLGIERSKCRASKSGDVDFFFDDKAYKFNENCIEQDYLDLLKKYNFHISWQMSFSSGITSFVYIGNQWILSDCVIVSYNRETKSILDYQLFTNVSGTMNYSRLYPDIDLMETEYGWAENRIN